MLSPIVCSQNPNRIVEIQVFQQNRVLFSTQGIGVRALRSGSVPVSIEKLNASGIEVVVSTNNQKLSAILRL